jgi:hypothetical protein
MSYGQILLVAALVFSGLYYYHTNELERQQKEHYNQLEREHDAREAAKYEREAERDRQQLEREKAEFKASEKAFAAQIERDYYRCFRRLPPKSFLSMDNGERAKFLDTVYPNALNNDERAVCDR